MIGTVLAEQNETPELLDVFRERIVKPSRERFRAILVRAIERGELASATDVDAIVATLVGSIYARSLAGEPTTRRRTERVVDLVLAGSAAS